MAIPGAARCLADRAGPVPDRNVRRLLHRTAVCADPDALPAESSLAGDCRKQYPERAIHGGRSRPRGSDPQCRYGYSAIAADDRNTERGSGILYLYTGAGDSAALHRLDAGALDLPA